MLRNILLGWLLIGGMAAVAIVETGVAICRGCRRFCLQDLT